MLKSAEAMNFFEYRSNELSMRLPTYLRQKKRGVCFFEASSNKRDGYAIDGFTIEVLTADSVKFHREIMMFENPQMNQEVMGARMRLLRRGKPSYLVDGLESFVTTHVSATNVTLIGYTVLFPLGTHNVYATFFGQGEVSAFDEACRQVVSSVRLLKPGELPLPLPKARYATGGLGRADTKQLRIILDGLPAEIAYLLRPILKIAREDQDLLGSGEGDTGSIEGAIKKISKGRNIEAIAAAHADILRQWLSNLPGHDQAWAAPIWFVEGFLRGLQLFYE